MQNEGKVHWKSWATLGLSKEKGILDFRDLKIFNKVLLVKQLSRVLNQPTSLVAQVLNDKYFKKGTLLEEKLGPNPSFVWKRLWSAMDLVKQDVKWRVGDG